jgi:hypothetical protein
MTALRKLEYPLSIGPHEQLFNTFSFFGYCDRRLPRTTQLPVQYWFSQRIPVLDKLRAEKSLEIIQKSPVKGPTKQ